ncbi:hypothetical protein KC878_02120 [Candidatus Saccharibacteria bacterium]|nr:hypothetical protein [Candidatus Saccharibacteria bacterium]MCB9821007.1 hypothetical protein [Candidatus Nomurabacteria bacterium]
MEYLAAQKVCAECPFWQSIRLDLRQPRESGFRSERIRPACRHKCGRLTVALAIAGKGYMTPLEVSKTQTEGCTVSGSLDPSPSLYYFDDQIGSCPENRNPVPIIPDYSHFDSGL